MNSNGFRQFRRGRGGRGRSAAQLQHDRFIFRHESRLNRGAVLTLPADPPRIVIAPWFNLTLMFHTTLNGGQSDVITVNDTLDWLRIQLGLPATVPNTVFRLRYLKIRVWADATTAAVDPLGILLEPFSLIGEGYQEKIQDWSGEIQYAKCGYVWPRHQQQTVFVAGAGSINTVGRVSVSRGTNVPLIYYLDVQWSSQTTIIQMLGNSSTFEVVGDEVGGE